MITYNMIERLKKINLIDEMDISDTIVCYKDSSNAMYLNIATGKRSADFNECIRDKKYVYVDSTFAEKYRKGWLSKYIPEEDVLLSVFYTLEEKQDAENSFEWKENFRLAISKTGYRFFVREICSLDACISDPYYADYVLHMEADIDLCGQLIHPCGENNNILLFCFGKNISLGSGTEIRKFCGGVFYGRWNSLNNKPHVFNTFDLYPILELFNKSVASDENFGIRETNMEGIDVKEACINEEVLNELGKAAKRCFDSNIKDYMDDFRDIFINGEVSAIEAAKSVIWDVIDVFEGTEACILENYDGEYVLRTFLFYPCGNADEETDIFPMGYVETKRVHITNWLLNDLGSIKCPLVWFDRDGIYDGVFKYVVKYLENAEEDTLSAIKSRNTIFTIPLAKAGNIAFPFVMAHMPLFEKLYNMFDSCKSASSTSNIKVLLSLLDTCTSIYNLFSWSFGDVNTRETELHKAIGVSRSVINLLEVGKLYMTDIKEAKSLFSSNPEILKNINREGMLEILEFMDDAKHLSGYCELHVKCFKRLMKIFGEKNFQKYMKFLLKEYSQVIHAEEYAEYLDKLLVISEGDSSLKASLVWKVKYSDLKKTDEAIRGAFNLFNDKKYYEHELLNFKKYEKKWQKYEYHGDKFIVIYPKGPTELVEEGLKLKHCVKNFIESVSEGKTLIMFIRRCDNPEKPFYTLEIKGNYIRQCHGFDDCNVSECNGLMDFLNEYSESKKLLISNSLNEALGV